MTGLIVGALGVALVIIAAVNVAALIFLGAAIVATKDDGRWERAEW